MVVLPSVIPWPVEKIVHDDSLLFYRIHKGDFKKGQLGPGAFRQREGAMSCDWCKYSTAAESRARARVAQDNGVISLAVGPLRSIPNSRFAVDHEPLNDNRSHMGVRGIGEKPERTPEEIDEARRVLYESKGVWKWEIHPSDPVADPSLAEQW